MHIRDWPTAERPREKLLAHGASILSDAELLAIFLGSGLRGRDTVQTARELLQVHGPLRQLLDRSADELAQLPGLGPARACKLRAALELGQRHLAADLQRGAALSDPTSAGRYFSQRLRARPHEVFAALFLDTRHRALAHNAAAVMIGHNHPSGNPEPSAADRAITTRLQQALALVDIRLLDHFVIGDGTPVSLAARGWI